MKIPKGPTPSLLSMATGTPSVHVCGKASKCTRCQKEISKGQECAKIPKSVSGFTTKPIYCVDCTNKIIAKTRADIDEVEKKFSDQ